MSKTLLIVDDEKDMGAMLKQYFELKGYNVALAENGVILFLAFFGLL